MRIVEYAMFVLAYAFVASFVVSCAGIAGFGADSLVMKVLWFAAGFFFNSYLYKLVFPYLDRKFP